MPATLAPVGILGGIIVAGTWANREATIGTPNAFHSARQDIQPHVIPRSSEESSQTPRRNRSF